MGWMTAPPRPYGRTAHVYDLIYDASGKDYAAEAAHIRDLIKARRPRAASLLDVACGTGLHLAHLREWFEVTGVDGELGMLLEARKRLRGVDLVEADMRSFHLEREFDAVVCLSSSIGYMRDRDELGQAIRTMADHVLPGGVLVVDGWVRPDAWIEGGPAHLDTAVDDAFTVARMTVTRREVMTTHLEMHHLVAASGQVEYVVDHVGVKAA